MADPRFPIGGVNLVGGGAPTPEQLHFKNFVCQNERMWTLRGKSGTPPRSANGLVNKQDMSGFTALMNAAQPGQLEFTEILEQANVTNLPNLPNWT